MTTNSNNLPTLQYKEKDSTIIHVNEVSKNVGEKVRLQSLDGTLTSQATCWWGTHQYRLLTWTTKLMYFIERFGGKNITAEAHIHKFSPSNDPKVHINNYEK